MTYTLYHYPRCSTCVKARRWLDQNGLNYELIDLSEDTPSAETLKGLHERSDRPLKALFNTSGKSYRAGLFKDKIPTMSEDEQLQALAADGMLIKRPILDARERVLIGFREAEWGELKST